MRHIIISVVSIIFLCACQEEQIPIPKPRLFPKVNYPERHYIKMDTISCPFSFEYPDYMKFTLDTTSTQTAGHSGCWFNLAFPSLNGDVHFTYTPLNPKDSLEQQLFKVYNDAYKMANEHVSKANGIEDLTINNPEKEVYGVLFSLEGSVASTFQIVVTDSIHHAVRAALYFKSRPAPDSMAPIIEFLRTDMVGMLNSFEWQTIEQ